MAAAKKAAPAAEGRTANKGMVCAAKGCASDAKSKGLCLKHYTQERRKDPEVRRKANEASKRTAAKRRAERAAAEK